VIGLIRSGMSVACLERVCRVLVEGNVGIVFFGQWGATV